MSTERETICCQLLSPGAPSSGGGRSAFDQRDPMTTGNLGSPRSKATSTWSPGFGRNHVPASPLAIIVETGAQVLGWSAKSGYCTRTLPSPSGSSLSITVQRNRPDRKSVGEGKSVSVRLELGGGRIIKQK